MTIVVGHGKNGLIYLSGTELEEANAWSISINTVGTAEYSKFGDSWMRRNAGINDWSGTLAAWHDRDSKRLQDAVTARTAVAILIYPQRGDLTTFYNGSAIFEMGSSADMTSNVNNTASFVGDNTLTMTGFSS